MTLHCIRVIVYINIIFKWYSLFCLILLIIGINDQINYQFNTFKSNLSSIKAVTKIVLSDILHYILTFLNNIFTVERMHI